MSDCRLSVAKLVAVVLTSNFILLTHSSKSSIWCVRRQMIAFSNFSTHAEISPRTEVRNLRAVSRKGRLGCAHLRYASRD